MLNFRAWLESASVREPWAWRGGGWQLTADRKDRGTTAAHQRPPIRLLWNMYDPRCLLGKLIKKRNRYFTSSPLYFFCHTFNLAAAGQRYQPLHLCRSPFLCLKQVPLSESPLLCDRINFEGGGLGGLLRASQTYAMQLCSIMGDQHLHNLYPSYSLRTNQMLFFQHESHMNNLYQ